MSLMMEIEDVTLTVVSAECPYGGWELLISV